MLNDLNTLIGFEIEQKIRGSTIFSQNLLPNYFIILQLYINSKLFFGMINRLADQCFLLLLFFFVFGGGGGASYFLSYNL